MAAKSFFKAIGGMLGEFLVSDIKEKVDEGLEGAKLKVEEIVEKVLKKLISFFILLLGFIFALVGLGKYLTETVAALHSGLGFVALGVALLLLGFFARYLSKA